MAHERQCRCDVGTVLHQYDNNIILCYYTSSYVIIHGHITFVEKFTVVNTAKLEGELHRFFDLRRSVSEDIGLWVGAPAVHVPDTRMVRVDKA